MLLVERRHGGTYSITVIEGEGRRSRGEGNDVVNHELSLLAAHPSRTKIYCPACTTHAAISYFIRDSANESYKLVSIGSGGRRRRRRRIKTDPRSLRRDTAGWVSKVIAAAVAYPRPIVIVILSGNEVSRGS